MSYQRDLRHVQTTSPHIGRNQHTGFASAEFLKNLFLKNKVLGKSLF